MNLDRADTVVDDIFVKELGVNASLLKDDVSYGDIPEWDSNTHMVVIAALEDAVGSPIDDDDILELTSIGAIKTYIRARNPA